MSQLRKLWAPWLLGTVACSAQPTTHTPIDAGILLVGDVFGGVDAKAKDAGGDASGQPDAIGADAGSSADVPDSSLDIASDTGAGSSDAGGSSTCPGAPGCSCTQAADCVSSLCLDTADGKRCPVSCGQGCASDQACVTLTGGDGQAHDVCVPKWGKLCYPCTASKDCEVPGLTGNLCIDQGPLGRFCGAKCTVDVDCPNGYACQVAQSPEGPKAPQCVRVAADGASLGTCACTPAAKAAAMSTPCYAEQKNQAGKVVGQCPGSRMCSPTGLGPCVLVATKAEVCDGIDNDCNGSVDDDASGCGSGEVCASGKCVASCAAVDGGWSAWVDGACSAACGGGTLVSTRSCTNPAPACGGKACVGDAQKTLTCNETPCVGNNLPAGTSTFVTGGQVVKGSVPPGKTSLTVWLWGGGGGGGFPGNGGSGGFAQVLVPVVAGDQVELRVAEGGGTFGGGGASSVWRNGQQVVVVAGGGGGGADGCSGCGGGASAGAGGGGGAIGGSGGSGTANNYVATNSGGGAGGTATAGGAGGIQANASAYSGCTQNGIAGSANAGGAGIGGYQCAPPNPGKCTASFEKGGTNCGGNGASGGGGSGWYGGGSGAAMYTYTGGGGGGGSSWAAGDVQVLATEAGSANGPGGMNSPQWQAGSGQGSPGKQQAFIGDPAGGHSGQITLTL